MVAAARTGRLAARAAGSACEALGQTADLGGELGGLEDLEVDTDRCDIDREAAQPVRGMQMTVADAVAARAELAERGVAVSEATEFPWGTFVFFSDPDGNGWALQQLPVRE